MFGILTKKEREKIEKAVAENKRRADSIILRKLKFMGRIQAEKVVSTGTVNYEEIAIDAENILAADDVVVGF